MLQITCNSFKKIAVVFPGNLYWDWLQFSRTYRHEKAGGVLSLCNSITYGFMYSVINEIECK